MSRKPLSLVFTLIMAIAVLVACGNDDSDNPTPEPTRDPVTPTQAATTVPTPTTAPMLLEATPEPTSSEVIMATPGTDVPPVGIDATPVDATATPVTATPVAAELTPLNGALTFEGRPQQDYVMTAEGCVGLGEWRMLKPGAQVVVKDASGTVVDVGTLESIESEDACEWVFAIDAPSDGFFSVTIPMVTEVWFHSDDDEVEAGDIELIVP